MLDQIENIHIIWAALALASFLAAVVMINIRHWGVRIVAGIMFPLSLNFILLWLLIKAIRKPKAKSSISTSGSGVITTEHNLSLKSDNGGHLEIANPYRGVLIIGGAGSGKSRSVISPIIDQMILKGYTGILYDFKFPDLSDEVYAYALHQPKKVKFFFVNFHDLSRTHRVNPLAGLTENAHAREFATALMTNLKPETISKPDFFSRSAISLLASSIWYFHEEHNSMCTLPHIISFLLWPDLRAIIDKLSENPLSADMVASVRSGLSSENQTAGVVSTLNDGLSVLSNKKVFYVLSGDDFRLNLNDPKSPKFICIGNNAGLADSLSPIISLTITAALKQMNQPGKLKSMVLLDEAPTLYIPNFDQIPATARSNKVATVFCAQDYSQMEDKYGGIKAEVIMSNLANQFWGKTTNPKTAEKVIKLFGKFDKVFETKSKGSSTQGIKGSSNQSVSQTIQERDRIKITDIRDLDPGEFYISTVETKHKEVKTRLANHAPRKETLPSFRSVTEEDIDALFREVKEDISMLMSKN